MAERALEQAPCHHGVSLVLTGALQLSALEASLARLVARHAGLRPRSPLGPQKRSRAAVTRYADMSDAAGRDRRASVRSGTRSRADAAEIFCVDLGPAVYACGRADALRGFVECQYEQHFDVQRGPLWSCAIARLDAASSCLVLCAHHSIASIATLGAWLTDLESGYHAAREPLA